METIAIPDSQRKTTRLGFGCSGIVGGLDRRRSLALLETAFDAGVRHFDVAPMYGFGTAEAVLGQFLQRHPGDVTVTTKFGVLPERRHPAMSLLYSVGKRVLQRTRPATPQRAAPPSPAPKPLRKVAFTVEQAADSLQQSLQRLRIDKLDIFLLHEAGASDLHESALLTFLHEQVANGTIGTFGAGSAPALLPELLRQKKEYCRVIQSDWSATDAGLKEDGCFRITHRALQGGWQSAYEQMCRSRRTSAWSEYVGVDLGDVAVWPKLLLRAALAVNTGTIVLFSTSSTARIVQNVTAAQDHTLELPSIRFHQLLSGADQARGSGLLMANGLRLSSATEGGKPKEQSVTFN